MANGEAVKPELDALALKSDARRICAEKFSPGKEGHTCRQWTYGYIGRKGNGAADPAPPDERNRIVRPYIEAFLLLQTDHCVLVCLELVRRQLHARLGGRGDAHELKSDAIAFEDCVIGDFFDR